MFKKTRLGAFVSITMVCGSAFASYTYTPVAVVGRSTGTAAVVAVGVSDGTDLIPYLTRVYRYNSSGSMIGYLQYNKVRATSAAMDTSDNVYIAGSYNGTDYYVAKATTGGAFWSHNWAGNGGEPVMPKIIFDSSGYLYTIGYSFNGTKYDSVAARFYYLGGAGSSFNDGTSYSSKWTDLAVGPGNYSVIGGVEKDSSGIAHAVGYKCNAGGSVFSSVSTGSSVYDARVAVDGDGRYYLAYSMTYIDRTPRVNEEELYVRKCSIGGFSATWTNYVVTSHDPRIFLAVDDYANAIAGSDDVSSTATTMHVFDSSTGSASSGSAGVYDAVGLYVDPGNGRWFAPSRWDLLAINDSSYYTPSVYEPTRVPKCSSYVRTGTDIIDGLFVASSVSGYKFLLETPGWTVYQS